MNVSKLKAAVVVWSQQTSTRAAGIALASGLTAWASGMPVRDLLLTSLPATVFGAIIQDKKTDQDVAALLADAFRATGSK